MAEDLFDQSDIFASLNKTTIRDLEFDVAYMRGSFPKEIEKFSRLAAEHDLKTIRSYCPNISDVSTYQVLQTQDFNLKEFIASHNHLNSLKQIKVDSEKSQSIKEQAQNLKAWIKLKNETKDEESS